MTKGINSTTFKLGVLAGLLFLSSVPRLYVDELVADRQRYEHEAIQSVIAGSHARHEVGSVKMDVPFYFYEKKDKKSEKVSDTKTFLPSRLNITFTDSIEVRHRGIFNIPVYKGDLDMAGSFVLPEDVDPATVGESVTPGAQVLYFNFAHPEAISEFSATINDQPIDVERVSTGLIIHMKAVTAQPGEAIKYHLRARMNGYEAFTVKTAAKDLTVDLKSKWPHLGYAGQLPIEQSEGAAHWHLIQSQESQAIEVNYVEPVNIYMQVSRALKYGFLITLLCLSVVFLMETLGGLRVQGMQYFLMTLPLTSFYVLLLAAAEHIGFLVAYGLATLSVLVLIYFYFSATASRRQSIGLAGSLAAVYGLILTMLSSEDYALLIGAITLFACLSAFMLMTRKLDWSNIRLKEVS